VVLKLRVAEEVALLEKLQRTSSSFYMAEEV